MPRPSLVRPAAIIIMSLTSADLGRAQSPTPAMPAADSMLRRLFQSGDFAAQRFGPARWLGDGESYTTLEPSADDQGATDIVRYATATGAREVHVPARRLKPEGEAKPLAIDDYVWSADGAKLLVFTNTEKVWRDNTRGDYWVLDLRSGALRKLGGPDAAPSSLMFAKFSPGGDRVAYVREGDIYVERLGDGTITRLTRDGSRTLVNGMSDWVYEEEFSLRDCFRWSPDGRAIAYWQFDMTGIRDFLMINTTDSLYPFTIPVQYPKAGTTNSAVRAGVVGADGGATTWLAIPGDPRDNYLPFMEWAGPTELVVQRVNRRQNRNEVMLADAATGAARTVFTDSDSAWVDVVDDFRWLDGGRHFLWVSERDGWRHVYLVSRDGREVRPVTPGAYDVVSLRAVDERGGWLYFTASPDNATQRYLFRASLKKPGAPERLSPAEPGTHAYQVAPNARWAFHTHSAFDRPTTIDLVALPRHAVARTLVTNDPLRAAVAPLLARPVEFFTVPVGGGVTLDGWMLRPRDFDSTRTYPVLFLVYGEPAGQTVLDGWGGSRTLWHRMLADLGYVVASVDNRGTPAPKGRAWRKLIYGSVGVLASQEQAEAVRALTRTRPYLDSTRVAVWGWSGGGSMTLNAMFRYPEVYQVGMSVAPVPDQRLYDTIYQERYMGLPQQNAEGYRLGSPITFAEGLRGRLLVMHGTGDDNVHYQGAERLADRLIALGKQFDFQSYPNRSHCICEGRGTTFHVYATLTRYLTANLPAGAR